MEDDVPPEVTEVPRAPRTNLMLAATIESGALKGPVRIRNLSQTGALLQGAVFPSVGEHITLRRLDLEIGATTMWQKDGYCGIRFDDHASVADWIAGLRSKDSSTSGQARVDRIQAAIRQGEPLAPEPISHIPVAAEGEIDRRVAEELDYVRRLLDALADTLSDEPVVVQRHGKALQGFDEASQILAHLSRILVADDRAAAIQAIGSQDLRSRLVRKGL